MTPPNTRDTEDDHVCPANERCPECHAIPLHLLHRMILERGDLRLTDEPFTELKRTGTGGYWS